MITSLTDDGNFSWDCPRCGIQVSPISHAEVERVDENTVALPTCPCCGNVGIWSRTFVKSDFTPQELTAPNMIDRATGQPTASHHAAQRHMAFVEQLKRQDDAPPQQENILSVEDIGGTHEATRGL